MKRILSWVRNKLKARTPFGAHLDSWFPAFSDADHDAAVELVDGAYDIVELWQPEGAYNIAWKQRWLEKARELGASSSM